MCDPVTAIAGASLAVGTVGTIAQHQGQKQQAAAQTAANRAAQQDALQDLAYQRTEVDAADEEIAAQRQEIAARRLGIGLKREELDSRRLGVYDQREELDSRRFGLDDQREGLDAQGLALDAQGRYLDIDYEQQNEIGRLRLDQVLNQGVQDRAFIDRQRARAGSAVVAAQDAAGQTYAASANRIGQSAQSIEDSLAEETVDALVERTAAQGKIAASAAALGSDIATTAGIRNATDFTVGRALGLSQKNARNARSGILNAYEDIDLDRLSEFRRAGQAFTDAQVALDRDATTSYTTDANATADEQTQKVLRFTALGRSQEELARKRDDLIRAGRALDREGGGLDRAFRALDRDNQALDREARALTLDEGTLDRAGQSLDRSLGANVRKRAYIDQRSASVSARETYVPGPSLASLGLGIAGNVLQSATIYSTLGGKLPGAGGSGSRLITVKGD